MAGRLHRRLLGEDKFRKQVIALKRLLVQTAPGTEPIDGIERQYLDGVVTGFIQDYPI